MNRTASTVWQYLAPNPNSCYRQLFIKGTRLRARVLYGMFMSAEEPLTPGQIAAEYNLPVEAVQEAIAYCQGNPPEIAQDLEREERLMQASGMNEPDYPRGGRFKVVPPEEVMTTSDFCIICSNRRRAIIPASSWCARTMIHRVI